MDTADYKCIERWAGAGVIRILGFGTVVDGLEFGRVDLQICRQFMAKLGKEI